MDNQHGNCYLNNNNNNNNMNVEILKRIISEKKTTLPSRRNQDWGTVKSETGRVNDQLTNIPTNNIKIK